MVIAQRQADAGGAQAIGGEGRGLARAARHQLALEPESRVGFPVRGRNAGNGVGQLRSEDAQPVAHAHDGSRADGRVVREAARAFQADQPGVLWHAAAARRADGAHETYFFGAGEQQRHMRQFSAARYVFISQQRRRHRGQVVAGVGAHYSFNNSRRGEFPARQAAGPELRGRARPREARRHGLERFRPGVERGDARGEAFPEQRVEDLYERAFEIRVLDAAAKLQAYIGRARGRLCAHYESGMVEVGGYEERGFAGAGFFKVAPGDHQIAAAVAAERNGFYAPRPGCYKCYCGVLAAGSHGQRR